MSRGRHGPTVDDDELVNAIANIAANGQKLPGGGVPLDVLTENTVFARDTLEKYCRELADRGMLERQWGIGPNGPQRTYLPANQRGND